MFHPPFDMATAYFITSHALRDAHVPELSFLNRLKTLYSKSPASSNVLFSRALPDEKLFHKVYFSSTTDCHAAFYKVYFSSILDRHAAFYKV